MGALGQTTRYAAFLWLGPLLLIAAAMFAPMFSLVPRLLWIMCTGLGGIFAMAFASEAADGAKRDRPSDVLLSARGLQVEESAGPGRSLSWAEVDAGACDILEAEPRRAVRFLLLSWLTLRKVPALVARERVAVARLRLPLRAGGDVLLAEAEGDERASLEALRDSIRSAFSPAAEVTQAALSPEILRCAQCGAPQVPVDQDAAPCPFCRHSVAMPEALRVKQRAVSALHADDAASARLVKRLLAQPGARSAGRVLWLGRKLMVLAQPGALIYLICLVYHQTADRPSSEGPYAMRAIPNNDTLFFYDIAVLALVVLMAFCLVWLALSAYFANRKALRVLAEGFGAVPPPQPGAPSTCRQCGAPLSEAANEVIVRCVYCRAQNVLGIDPRPAAARQRHERRSLQSAARQRRWARLRLVLTLPLCAFFGISVVREAVLMWWVPPFAASADCYGYCGSITNHDLTPRLISITDNENPPVRVTLLPRSTISWESSHGCIVAHGAQQLSTDALGANSFLAIQHGMLQVTIGATP